MGILQMSEVESDAANELLAKIEPLTRGYSYKVIVGALGVILARCCYECGEAEESHPRGYREGMREVLGEFAARVLNVVVKRREQLGPAETPVTLQ